MNGFGNDAGDWLIVARALHFAATAMISGILIFRSVVAKPVLFRAQWIADVFDRQSVRLAWVSLVVSVTSGVAWILLQASSMSGLSFGETMTADTIGTVMTETRFGLISEVRLGLTIILAAGLWSDRLAGARWVALASSLGLLSSIGWTGHAGSTAGGTGMVHLIADMLHLIAAASWLGGVVSLALLLVVAAHCQPRGWTSLARDAVQRFSVLGVASVATLLVSGVLNAAILVGSLHALLVTGYGRLLIVKIALFAVMLGFAAVNRFRLTPGLADFSGSEQEHDAVRRLTRNCVVEIALGLAIFAIVGALGTIHPARHL